MDLNHGVQIDLEAYGRDIDFEQLEGFWRLIYTTALDVVCPLSAICLQHVATWQIYIMYVQRCLPVVTTVYSPSLFRLPGVIAGASGHATKSILTSANRQYIPEIWLSRIWPLPEHHQSQCPLCARRRHVHVCHWLCMQCVCFSVTCLLALLCYVHKPPPS